MCWGMNPLLPKAKPYVAASHTAMYLTRKLKLGQTDQLDALARRAGDLWSTVAKWHGRFVRRQSYWLGANPVRWTFLRLRAKSQSALRSGGTATGTSFGVSTRSKKRTSRKAPRPPESISERSIWRRYTPERSLGPSTAERFGACVGNRTAAEHALTRRSTGKNTAADVRAPSSPAAARSRRVASPLPMSSVSASSPPRRSLADRTPCAPRSAARPSLARYLTARYPTAYHPLDRYPSGRYPTGHYPTVLYSSRSTSPRSSTRRVNGVGESRGMTSRGMSSASSSSAVKRQFVQL